jgi:glycosyltransferase involved in cell wall biosynthesis|tara:strand:- start:1792 stop:2922 length:1131 start_codon:yes stop_codon:yes gene_type:complete
MNILVISYIYPNPEKPILGSFVERQLVELAQHHNVHVITRGKSDWPKNETVQGVFIHRIVSDNPLLSPFKYFVKIIKLNKRFHFDVLHSHFTGILTVVCGIASKVIKKPFFVTAYGLGLDPVTASFFRKVSIKLSFKLAKKIINISRYTKNLSEHYAPKKKNIVITYGIIPSRLKATVNAKKFREKHKLGKGIILLSVANLTRRKGIDIIISVLPDIVKKYLDLKYILVGKGEEEKELKGLVKKLNITKNVIFWPTWIPDKDLANFYNASDIFILMSRSEGQAVEGFGIVYVEASALGKPVIGGKSGGTSDSVVDGKTGFLIDPGNIELIKSKLFLLIRNMNLRKKMGTYAKNYVRKNHLQKNKTSQLVKLYSEFI